MDRLLSRYSSWQKLRKAAGWIIYAREDLRRRRILYKQVKGALEREEPNEEMREKLAREKMKKFKTTSMMNKDGENLTMTFEMLQKAEDSIIHYVQQRHFPEELAAKREEKEVKKSSPLYKLDPLLVDGILRVGGRLSRAAIPEHVKHPIVLLRALQYQQ